MKTRWLAVSVRVFLSLVVLLAVTDTGYAGWGAKWKKNFTGSPDIKEPGGKIFVRALPYTPVTSAGY